MTALRRMTIKSFSGISAALMLALGAPAAAQNSDAPVDVTAAPPPSADTIGPAQLQNFNLQGTVTRPAERPAANPTQPAAAQPSAAVPVDSVSSPTVNAATNRAPESRGNPTRPPAARPLAAPPVTSDSVTPSVPLDVTTNTAPQPSYDAEASPIEAPLGAERGGLSWPWLAALVALIGGGAFIAWSRRGRRQRYGDPGRHGLRRTGCRYRRRARAAPAGAAAARPGSATRSAGTPARSGPTEARAKAGAKAGQRRH